MNNLNRLGKGHPESSYIFHFLNSITDPRLTNAIGFINHPNNKFNESFNEVQQYLTNHLQVTSNQSGKRRVSSYGKAGGSNKRSNKSKGGSNGRSRGGSSGGSKGGSKRTNSDYYSPKEWNALSAEAKAMICLQRQKSNGTGQASSSATREVQSVNTDSDGNGKPAPNPASNAGSQFGSTAHSKRPNQE
mmetsp:Transcript_13510/g.28531  ORF Transcript_13510/g.28531 Transcript_13510/m.28531 type:complete len:189 (-) Transcript_13510:2172-2738(-)